MKITVAASLAALACAVTIAGWPETPPTPDHVSVGDSTVPLRTATEPAAPATAEQVPPAVAAPAATPAPAPAVAAPPVAAPVPAVTPPPVAPPVVVPPVAVPPAEAPPADDPAPAAIPADTTVAPGAPWVRSTATVQWTYGPTNTPQDVAFYSVPKGQEVAACTALGNELSAIIAAIATNDKPEVFRNQGVAGAVAQCSDLSNPLHLGGSYATAFDDVYRLPNGMTISVRTSRGGTYLSNCATVDAQSATINCSGAVVDPRQHPDDTTLVVASYQR